VDACWRAGVGTTIEIAVGNRVPLAHQGLLRQPMQLTGSVRALSDGDCVVSGPIYTGSTLKMGRTVLFDTGVAQLVLTTERVEPYDRGVFECVGLDAASQTYLLLKSRMYCRPVFGPMARGLVECDSDRGGPTSSNYALFPFQKIRRPIAPLDADAAW